MFVQGIKCTHGASSGHGTIVAQTMDLFWGLFVFFFFGVGGSLMGIIMSRFTLRFYWPFLFRCVGSFVTCNAVVFTHVYKMLICSLGM